MNVFLSRDPANITDNHVVGLKAERLTQRRPRLAVGAEKIRVDSPGPENQPLETLGF